MRGLGTHALSSSFDTSSWPHSRAVSAAVFPSLSLRLGSAPLRNSHSMTWRFPPRAALINGVVSVSCSHAGTRA
jgi:hypothetical protein